MGASPSSCVEIPPHWRIGPADCAEAGTRTHLVIDPGPGFGDGTHETTRLCLQAIAALRPHDGTWRMLDFGSGSGILTIGAARLGAIVDAIEIDPLAAAHGERNARVNRVSTQVRHMRSLAESPGPFDLVVANILRPVLVDFADALVSRVASGAALVLSGLVSTDVPAVSARYSPLLGDRRPEVYTLGEWRALVWRRIAPSR
jgi:ribosomal protein L11 methyltransferase